MQLRISCAALLLSGLWLYASDGIQSIARDNAIPLVGSHDPRIDYCVGPFAPDESFQAHYEERPIANNINTLVMHYTAVNFAKTMRLFTRNTSWPRASAHYVITQREDDTDIEGGRVVQVVPEAKRAWHAGPSCWREEHGLNDTAIGIEHVNYGFDSFGIWCPFDGKQIASLGSLSKDIVTRYEIEPRNIVGHADISPMRKVDPGVMFPWSVLYYFYGVGAWLENRTPAYISARYVPQAPLPSGVSEPFVFSMLKQYGYPVQDPGYNTPENQSVIKAFKAHFSANQCPSRYTSTITRDEMIWAWGLLAKYARYCA